MLTRVKPVAVMALVLAALLLVFSVYMHFTFVFWGDQDWELLVSRMWLQGKKLYVDQVPVTAPLLFYLYALPAFLSQHMPLQDYQALVLLALCAILPVIAVSARLIRSHPGFSNGSKKRQFIVLLCFLLVLRIRPVFFADREYFCILLTLPYLLLWMPGLKGAAIPLRLRLLIGALAAPGFFIKPHCLLLLAAIQLVTLLRIRSWRALITPENLVIYGLGAMYGWIVWHDMPDYLTLILPMAYYTYSAIHGSPGGLYALLLSLMLTYAMLRPGQRSAYRGDIYYFTALLPFFYLYARINNGWAYSYQPLMTLLLLTNGFVLWECLSLKRSWQSLLGAMLCLVNFSLETGYALDYDHRALNVPCRGDRACPGYYKPFLDEMQGAHSFGTLGMDFTLWTRVAKLSGAQWDTRFAQFWMLPKLYIAADDFYREHLGIFTYVANALAEDLDRNKPDVVFVEVSSSLYTLRFQKPIDWPADFSAVPAFKAAWEHYRFTHTIDNCTQLQPSEEADTVRPEKLELVLKEANCRYEVYRRLP